MLNTMTLLSNLRRLLTLLAVLAGVSMAGVAGATDFNLSLTKTADVSSVVAGGTVNFTIKVSNAGPYSATNVVIQDALPKGFKFVSATPSPASTDSTSDPKVVKYTFNLGTIASRGSSTISLKATGVDSSSLGSPTIGSGYDYINVAQVYSVDVPNYDSSGSRPNNCSYSTILAGTGMEDDCAKVAVSVSGGVTPPPTPPVSGTCTATSPYTQSFNTNAALAEVVSPYVYKTDPNVVTATDGTYALWNGIDHTGNSGYALYMNIANYAGNNGARLSTPALLYQSTINVPVGGTISYQDYVRSHSTVYTQLRYVFTDTSSGTVLKQYDGIVANTNYQLDAVPSFTATGAQVTLRIYSIFDGTSADANVLKLDDLKLSCTAPAKPSLTLTKTGNGPWTVGQGGASYTLAVTNSGAAATSGTVTVKDLLPTGLTPSSASFTTNGWTCSTSGQTLTCTSAAVINAGASSAISFGVNVDSTAVGSITNQASVGGGGDPDPQPDPSSCTATGGQCATYTTTVSPVATQCSGIYALTISSSGSNTDGIAIRKLDETTNTLGTLVASLPYTGYYQGTSATLGVSPDGKRFFTALDSDRLRVYDTTSGQWYSGSTFSNATNRLVRMAVTPDGTGYAMDSDGNFWSFQTLSPYSTSYLGKLNSASSGAPDFHANGDFFATADGKLYMISSVTGAADIDLWLVTPGTLKAEYLGPISVSGATQSSQFNGIAASPNGIYARDNLGRLVKIDVLNLTYTAVGSNTLGSTDLASCYYPVYAPKLDVTKSVKKVAGLGTTGDKVQPGDTLEYTVVVRNSGTLPAGGVTFQDALPAGTTYVADSARVNGATTTVTSGAATNLSGPNYPFGSAVGICSSSLAPCTTQVLKIDTTSGVLDNEAVITFRVKVNNPFTLTPSEVTNQASVNYTGGTPVPSNKVTTPVYQPAKLKAEKTVLNVTSNASGQPGKSATGNPGDVLEYCVTTTNIGGLNANNIVFGDTVASNTLFLVGGYGAGKDIKVTTTSGTVYYTAAADGDLGAVTIVSGNQRVTVNGGSTFSLAANEAVTVCFRTTIK